MDWVTMLKLWMFIMGILFSRFASIRMEGDLCSGGHDLSVDIQENSPDGTFIARLAVNGNLSTGEIHLNLTGTDLEWFQMEEKIIKLNVLPTKPLDRELLTTPLLFATITCTDVISSAQIHHRLMVQVLNENDNSPVFLKESVQPLNISELTPIGEILFRLQAHDEDGDGLIYVVDRASKDAEFFKIDLPNSGNILLAQRLDYESKKELDLMVYAMEMNTEEKYNTTAKVTISVLDGDDQYPRFLPCKFVLHGKTRVCVNPTYTGNVTEAKLPYHALQLSPGPLLAEDGDKGLQTQVAYSILIGDDNGRFEVNNVTGAMMMRWPVRSLMKTPLFSLTVMASQVDDPTKYTVTTVLIRVLAQNHYQPRFNTTKYEGFVQEQTNPFAVVVTYGNKLLLLEAIDQDFKNGRNPNIVYTLANRSNHTQLFQVTQEGLLIARTDRLHAREKYMLQFVGFDKESGDVVSTRVNVEILHSSQPVPSGLAKESRKYSSKEIWLMGGITLVVLLFLISTLVLLIHNGRERYRHRRHRGTIAIEQNTNVSLKWFQMNNTNKTVSSYSNLAYTDEIYSIGKEESNNECATNNLWRIPNPLLDAAQEPDRVIKSVFTNGKLVQTADCKSMCIKSNLLAKESHTNIKHQCSECKNEPHRVIEDFSLGIDLQSATRVEKESGKDNMEKGTQHENKADVSEFIKETAFEEARHLQTMLGEIECSIQDEDWSANSAGESDHATCTAEGQENQITAKQKKVMAPPEQENLVTTPEGQAHVICSETAGSVDQKVVDQKVQNVITGTDYPPSIAQPLIARQPAVNVQLGNPLVVQHPISENPVEHYVVSAEHPSTIQHPEEVMSTDYLLETNCPETVDRITITEKPLPGEIAVGNPAAMVIEGVIFQCPTTGVTIEIQEGGMEGTVVRKTSNETANVTTEDPVVAATTCSLPEVATDCLTVDVAKNRLTEGQVIEGQSSRQVIAEDTAAGGLTMQGAEERVPVEDQMKAKDNSATERKEDISVTAHNDQPAGRTGAEMSVIASIQSSAEEINAKAREPAVKAARRGSVVTSPAVMDYSIDAAR
ncbi:uncharacterized protein LOC116985302 [Amblyraja radiata]|uniref:uncharacterized protein LOC116985302 n=1 Tax=Amblyraja radiata TaxID=386614 RepID=UPI0014026CA5|nr:uncharacterized protein LOC116985302 [Amblyraja radiata]